MAFYGSQAESGRNIGAAAAWKLGFKKFNGDCVLFSNDDNVLHPQEARKAVSLISNNKSFVRGDYGIVQYRNGKCETVEKCRSPYFGQGRGRSKFTLKRERRFCHPDCI